ncbi:adenylate cyclase-like protein [Obba rivulosa]|uniref:Adenylate cyclase n=1 Tax=Obba rivulosa TaxID=1052685 RepID=A0A8E2DKP5_9APHY|nr:adenylate cyclase-like protein [Obba rivulosa]
MDKPAAYSSKTKYKIRIHRADNTYHVVSITLDVTVGELTPQLNKKLLLDPERETHKLYLKERGRERVLAQTEHPADIVRRRLEQAGYDVVDGLDLLGAEDIQFLMKFVYKSNLLGMAEEETRFDTFDLVDLTGRSLRTVPIALYPNADGIVSLNLSRNPMLEIPLDFIQSCTTLRELRLSHMAMKKVPQSVRHCVSLHRLDISCNRIADLNDAGLDYIPELRSLKVQNNRMENLPFYFPRLRALKDLNISNNKFKRLPAVVSKITSLVDLDISFNMIESLPDDIGQLQSLERLIIVGNQVSRFPDDVSRLQKLRMLDCRRNSISDISLVCMLPQVEQIYTDYNSIHALELSFGPSLQWLDASNNDITQLTLVPGPLGQPYRLTSLDVSYAKLSSLDELALAQLTALQTLRVDHNSLRTLPDSLGSLTMLKHLSCSNNQLYALPTSIGRLQRLEVLEAHNNDLAELPATLWNCASLQRINATSNLIASWPLPSTQSAGVGSGSISAEPSSATTRLTVYPERKASSASLMSGRFVPPLAHSLEKLYLGENQLTDVVLHPLALLKELRVLNLSFNDLQDVPPTFFKSFVRLRELYLSGNNIRVIPIDDFHYLRKLDVLFLNGNKLQTLPSALGQLKSLAVLDVGSNELRYNIHNWEFDWNWNSNPTLRYLNLSGNKRLEIKPDKGQRLSREHTEPRARSDFSELKDLKILGLMDVTTAMAENIPDENENRRVRTSGTEVNGIAYGIADTLGKTEQINMLDLVQPHFRERKNEAVFAMFGRPSHFGSNPSLNKFLHDKFLSVFQEELGKLNRHKGEEVGDAMRRAFLKLNKSLHDHLYSTSGQRKMSHVSTSTAGGIVHEISRDRTGASGIVLYVVDKRLYVANVGDSLAVISNQGNAKLLSRKHDPFDRDETSRIRSAEGWVSPKGFVNDEVDVSRSFGFYPLLPVVNARPDIHVHDLSELDEFVIIANIGLWKYVSPQTAVDIARSARSDPMIAAQKLRDFVISYGAEGTTMIMVVAVSDLLKTRSRQLTSDALLPDDGYHSPWRTPGKGGITNRGISRLEVEVPPPTGHVALVFTDIRNSTHLWEVNPGMPTAMNLHNNLLRRQLRFCGGYEVKTEGDAFMCSFPTVLSALWWCMSVQLQLLELSWPLEILECDDGKEIFDESGRLVARGLSVRMGIHCGQPVCEPDPITHRMDYFGPMVNRSARINGSAAGGQIMCSADVVREVNARIFETEPETELSYLQPAQAIEAIRRMQPVVLPVGETKLKGIEIPELLSAVYPKELAGRHGMELPDAMPTVSSSRMHFSVEQMRQLGLLCVRLEALSSGRVFKELPGRKGSTATSNPPPREDARDSSLVILGDPSLILPQVSNASDADLMLLLDSLSQRIDNALAKLALDIAYKSSRGADAQEALQRVISILYSPR